MFDKTPNAPPMEPDFHLREWRKRRGLTLQQVADLTGVELAAISRYERGEREPNVSKILVLARALNIHPADLFRTPDEATLDALVIGLTHAQRAVVFRTVEALARAMHDEFVTSDNSA